MANQLSYYPDPRTNMDRPRRRWSPWYLVAIAALVAVVLLGVAWTHMPFNQRPVAQTKPPAASTMAHVKCDNSQAVTSILLAQGFQRSDFTVGADKFNLSLPAAKQAGPGSFSRTPLSSMDALMAFMKSSDPAAEAAREHVSTQGAASLAQMQDPKNWTGFQLLIPSTWSGNTVYVNRQEKNAGELKSQAGDVGWIFINPLDCTQAGLTLQDVALIRMGCANPQNVLPAPTTPPGGQGGCSESNCSPTPMPQCPPGQHPSPVRPSICIMPKDGSQDVNVNSAVPSAVQGPGTHLGGNPPPAAVPPTDSPTGCHGPCPGHSPTPVSTAPPVPTPIASDPPPSTPIPTPPPSS